MKVSGFSFIRNAVKYDYPVVEAIESVLPLCDEFILALGNSDDKTEEIIKNIASDKIKIIHTTWNENLKEGGKVLAAETNKALNEVGENSDWCIYIQGDECVHENDYEKISAAMKKYCNNKEVEGLLFNYLHFYGTYNYITDSYSRYKNEIRIVKNNIGVSSWLDAQGFRIDGRKLKVKKTDATIYHYGMVKTPKQMQDKFKYFHTLWHEEHIVKKMTGEKEFFDFNHEEKLFLFTGTHPAVMKERIEKNNLQLDFDPTKNKLRLKVRFKIFFEKIFGIRLGEYKNYILLK